MWKKQAAKTPIRNYYYFKPKKKPKNKKPKTQTNLYVFIPIFITITYISKYVENTCCDKKQ